MKPIDRLQALLGKRISKSVQARYDKYKRSII